MIPAMILVYRATDRSMGIWSMREEICLGIVIEGLYHLPQAPDRYKRMYRLHSLAAVQLLEGNK